MNQTPSSIWRRLVMYVAAALFGIEVMLVVRSIERGDRVMLAWSSALAVLFFAYVVAAVVDRLTPRAT